VQRSGMTSATGVTDRRQATAAPARAEAGCPHRHHAEQRDQAPGPQILQRALRPASFAAAPAAAVLVHLRRDEMALHHGQDPPCPAASSAPAPLRHARSESARRRRPRASAAFRRARPVPA
jgi:hypothetical protein